MIKLASGLNIKTHLSNYNNWFELIHLSVLFHRVVCSMLGYSNGFVTSVRLPGLGNIWLDEVSCAGWETDIALCPHSSWGSHNCGHSEDVSVRCVASLTEGENGCVK